jgi:hypothetical protein
LLELDPLGVTVSGKIKRAEPAWDVVDSWKLLAILQILHIAFVRPSYVYSLSGNPLDRQTHHQLRVQNPLLFVTAHSDLPNKTSEAVDSRSAVSVACAPALVVEPGCGVCFHYDLRSL